jgi:AAA15 family ATPase/GTPase
MVKEVRIQNYKSVQDLTLELGRVNILIGANGCGKSNILEAIAFGSAAAENKLGKEFLSARGIRVTEPMLMKSGFSKETIHSPILVSFDLVDDKVLIEINSENSHFSEWTKEIKSEKINNYQRKINDIERINNNITSYQTKQLVEAISNFIFEKPSTLKIEQKVNLDPDSVQRLLTFIQNNKLIIEDNLKRTTLENTFLIFAPENTFLRKFEDESQIEPLGIRGEGLFKLLSVMSQETPEEFQEIIENLELIDWFEGFEIPKDLVFTERRIRIKDRFLEEGLQYFDQRSANEGFLFLMFYFALFISKYTPKFFAIDNIDTSLNPKLCSELIKILSKLAKKHDKQVIFTTHNPAVLDGLNLNDDEQRLLVVSRNKDGHTKTKRVLPIATPEGEIPVRLSEQFMRGYIGGLPKNF